MILVTKVELSHTPLVAALDGTEYVKNSWVSSAKICEYGAQTDTSPCETTWRRHTVRHCESTARYQCWRSGV